MRLNTNTRTMIMTRVRKGRHCPFQSQSNSSKVILEGHDDVSTESTVLSKIRVGNESSILGPIMKYFLMILALGGARAQDYEYYEENTEPDTVLGYLYKEAVNQLQSSAETESSDKEEKPDVSENEIFSESLFDVLKEKFFETESNVENEDPVYNFIMVFSALALFFQAFYTPFGKVSISGRKKRELEESQQQLTALGYERSAQVPKNHSSSQIKALGVG